MKWSRTCVGTVWKVPGAGGWHFVTLPPEVGQEVRELFGGGAWGSVRVEAKIGRTTWSTSIWPDKPSGSYVLPVKGDVRKREKIAEGDETSIRLTIAR